MTISFDPSILQNNPAVRGRMLAILQAALDAARPDMAVKAQLHRAGSQLSVAGETIDLAACRRIFVLGAGKDVASLRLEAAGDQRSIMGPLGNDVGLLNV